ncbi:ATP synthase epsilon chain [Ktedonobacter sp. SOSP1-52]|uniref:F0F1 ATP synthase subunit epsilon n=1 Tax=Ktedonobacter sp. SOSP1-52 TaxID=2778366 RepID=UPI0019165E3E|nr:F0F1 ATP synthase subunit epsilon [Ktedonobacter sp. SOSP1-52]GHO66431.1 ATP synthase epsilon chain [Ktedonobacter sp. SOSP1-52]
MATTTIRNTLHVEVVTAERELYNGEATLVSAPGVEGRLGILPHHAALLTFLKPGELRIELGDAEEPFFVSGGFLEVSHDRVTILADAAEEGETIDEARAQEARRVAEERLAESRSQNDRAEAQAALERALSRIRVAEYARRRSRRRIDTAGMQQ